MCLVPTCFGCNKDVERMRETDDKIRKDMHYLKLVKLTDTCWRLSAALFSTLASKDLALIYLKEKIDERDIVVPEKEVEKPPE